MPLGSAADRTLCLPFDSPRVGRDRIEDVSAAFSFTSIIVSFDRFIRLNKFAPASRFLHRSLNKMRVFTYRGRAYVRAQVAIKRETLQE